MCFKNFYITDCRTHNNKDAGSPHGGARRITPQVQIKWAFYDGPLNRK